MSTNIGLPSISIAFKELASTAIQRGDRGIVALVLRDAEALVVSFNIKATIPL